MSEGKAGAGKTSGAGKGGSKTTGAKTTGAKTGGTKTGPAAAKAGDRNPAKAAGAQGTVFSSKPCPICGKPSVERYRPFCSKRCADIDLNRWLTGAYAIPVVEEEDEDGDGPRREQD